MMQRGDRLIYFTEGNSGTPRKLFFVETHSDSQYGCRGSKPKDGDKATATYDKNKLLPYSASLFRALREWRNDRNAKSAREREPKSKPKQPDTVTILPNLDADQAKTFQEALDRKQHAEYLCYMMLEELNRQLPLKQLVELGVKRTWCSEESLVEFFDVGVAQDEEDGGCCSAEGHTIESLLALWRESTNSMLEAVKGK